MIAFISGLISALSITFIAAFLPNAYSKNKLSLNYQKIELFLIIIKLISMLIFIIKIFDIGSFALAIIVLIIYIFLFDLDIFIIRGFGE